MLTLRDAQRDILLEDRFHQLRAWLKPHLRRHFAAQLSTMPDDELVVLIADGVSRAREIGASGSASIGQFVHLRVLFGDGFEALPWVARTLEEPGLRGDVKLALLTHRARALLATRTERAT